MNENNNSYGFGYNPELSKAHFFVIVPVKTNEMVQVYERFGWTEDGDQLLSHADILRIEMPRHKWNKVGPEVATEFNARLKKDKMKFGKFQSGGTPLEKLFGKELMVLLWGIEDCDPSVIPTAVRNWKGLMPEERWWLYTMTNASTGKLKDKRGWRIALRYALCENPVEDNPQISLIDMFIEE